MKVIDFYNLRSEKIYYQLVSYDLAGNVCSTQMYMAEKLPNEFMNANVTGFAIIKFDVLQLHTDLIGDPFHKK